MLIYKCAVRINSFWLSNVKDLQLIKRHARWLHANTVEKRGELHTCDESRIFSNMT